MKIDNLPNSCRDCEINFVSDAGDLIDTWYNVIIFFLNNHFTHNNNIPMEQNFYLNVDFHLGEHHHHPC